MSLAATLCRTTGLIVLAPGATLYVEVQPEAFVRTLDAFLGASR